MNAPPVVRTATIGRAMRAVATCRTVPRQALFRLNASVSLREQFLLQRNRKISRMFLQLLESLGRNVRLCAWHIRCLTSVAQRSTWCWLVARGPWVGAFGIAVARGLPSANEESNE